MPVGFGINDFAAGGIMPEGDYRIDSIRFVPWDYDGKISDPVLAVAVHYQPIAGGKPTTDEPTVQHYSAGSLADFTILEDGRKIEASGSKKAISKQSNFYIFVENLINSGFPDLGDDLSVIDGTDVHIHHIPAPKRAGMPTSKLIDQGAQAQERERTIAVPNAILAAPKTAPKGKPAAKPTAAKPAAKAAPAPAPETESADETGSLPCSEDLANAIMEVLNSNDKLTTMTLRLAVHRAIKDAEVKKEATKVLANNTTMGPVLEALGYKISGANVVAA